MAARPEGRDWLSRTLAELRKQAGLSGSRAARAAGISQSRISRIETGRFVPDAGEITALCALYDSPDTVRRQLLETAEALKSGTSSARVVISHGSWKMQQRIAQVESNAAEVWGYQPALIIGLLQTADYARLVFGDGGDIAGDDLDRAVRQRMARASVLDSDRSFTLIMAEGALRWQAGSPDVMLGQLQHLAAVVRDHPQARIGIIPQSRPAEVFTTHGFSVYDQRTVIMGIRTGTSFISDEADVAEYVKLFGELESIAVFGDEALEVMARVAESYRTLGR